MRLLTPKDFGVVASFIPHYSYADQKRDSVSIPITIGIVYPENQVDNDLPPIGARLAFGGYGR